MTSILSAIVDLVRGPAPRAGYQPTLPGPLEPPRTPADWRAPEGAVNPITQQPFASVRLIPVVDLDQPVAIPVHVLGR